MYLTYVIEVQALYEIKKWNKFCQMKTIFYHPFRVPQTTILLLNSSTFDHQDTCLMGGIGRPFSPSRRHHRDPGIGSKSRKPRCRVRRRHCCTTGELVLGGTKLDIYRNVCTWWTWSSWYTLPRAFGICPQQYKVEGLYWPLESWHLQLWPAMALSASISRRTTLR